MYDRESLYPGRVKMTPVSGQENVYDMVMADEATQAGTPPITGNLFPDLVAEKMLLDKSATVAKGFEKLLFSFSKIDVHFKTSNLYTTSGSHTFQTDGKAIIAAVGGGGSGGGAYFDSSNGTAYGGGGGSGRVIIEEISISKGDKIDFVIGAGGKSVGQNQNGVSGGSTIVSGAVNITAPGGGGGFAGTQNLGGAGGNGEAGGGAGFGRTGNSGGNGNTYGGGGGSSYRVSSPSTGGMYGGNGGAFRVISRAGQEFADNTNYLMPFAKIQNVDGKAGGNASTNGKGGCGGYGGNGGDGSTQNSGGGGGYGGNGGNGGSGGGGGGGGGGYGGNGGDGTQSGGGGGGFFGNGGQYDPNDANVIINPSNGGGGCGSRTISHSSGAGADGLVLVLEYLLEV